VLAEGTAGGFAGIYPVLKAMEETGSVRRGYFVAGLGAAQFALPGAVDRLREARRREDDPAAVVLAAADPAQPYGAALPWPPTAGGRPSRSAGAYLVLVDGGPAAFLERGARSLVTFDIDPGVWADALASLVKDGRLRTIDLARIDGAAPADDRVAEALRAVGFGDSYRGLSLRG
jgi:ATP-dependent Lhr-like helicase